MDAPITFTLDLEDHRPNPTWPVRFPAIAERLLDDLDDWGVTATFFVVGELAAEHPALIESVAARGHELALHSWAHVQLTLDEPHRFRAETAKGKDVLEQAAGQACVGYRAPTFSLVPTTTWALDLLGELGFTYSSSVLPARSPLWGWPGAPRRPFRWPQGLVEFPAPVAAVGPVALPYLGGTYLRLLPRPAIELARRRLDPDGSVPWMYLHAYDTDTEEPFWWVPDSGWLAPLLWVGRRGVLDKAASLLRRPGGAGPPLRERLDEVPADRVFVPS